MKRTIKLSGAGHVIRLPLEFCIRCGTSEGTRACLFTQQESNPVAHFAKLAGDTGMLAELILNKHHEVEARFCKMCFHKLESVTFRGQLFHLFFVVSIFITVLSAIYVNSVAGFENSLWVVGIGICLAIGLRVYARYYTWTSSPKITNVNKKRLVLKVPGHGKFVFERSASKLEHVSEGKT